MKPRFCSVSDVLRLMCSYACGHHLLKLHLQTPSERSAYWFYVGVRRAVELASSNVMTTLPNVDSIWTASAPERFITGRTGQLSMQVRRWLRD
ncbi:hypothetical protein RRG08_001081 [Elysia crispata]|uniref:Uncharacterized protein n=1 Tax=Elysia crispata TaxID=231223 RepID=A0AAE1AVU6_9GAST|nr:hypothetical protein RRG08_001081 [Elysia crispata]